jgi:predicted nucleic acid-binding protein
VELVAPDRPIRIYLDANVFISSVEGPSTALVYLVEQASAGLAALYTSELTLAEVLVVPLKKARRELVDLYESMLVSGEIPSVIPVDRDVLRASAELRATVGNKGGDAIHVATALRHGCDYFVSSDKRIRLPLGLKRVEADLVTGLEDRE